MRTASDAGVSQIRGSIKKDRPDDSERAVLSSLELVASSFVRAQQRRNQADYNVGLEWTHTEVIREIEPAEKAFEAWARIREEPMAQAYLVSLLGSKARRPDETETRLRA